MRLHITVIGRTSRSFFWYSQQCVNVVVLFLLLLLLYITNNNYYQQQSFTLSLLSTNISTVNNQFVSYIVPGTIVNSFVLPVHRQQNQQTYTTQLLSRSISQRIRTNHNNNNNNNKCTDPSLKSSLLSLYISPRKLTVSTSRYGSKNDFTDEIEQQQLMKEKFGWKQRIASVQSLILGAIVGSIAQAPISLIHSLLTIKGLEHVIAQWEYDTDMAAITGGLFAIIYRYIIRSTDTTNVQLQQGFISSMILIRTLPQINIPYYCSPIPLNCNSPPFYFYIFDYNIIQQLLWCGFESTALFVATAIIMDQAMEKGYIIRFPG